MARWDKSRNISSLRNELSKIIARKNQFNLSKNIIFPVIIKNNTKIDRVEFKILKKNDLYLHYLHHREK